MEGWLKVINRRMSGDKTPGNSQELMDPEANGGPVVTTTRVDPNDAMVLADIPTSSGVEHVDVNKTNGGSFAGENRFEVIRIEENVTEVVVPVIIDNCGECKKLFSSIRNKGSSQCCLCTVWFCHPCMGVKSLGAVTNIKRDDVYWVCKDCKPRMDHVIQGANKQSTESTGATKNENESIEETVERVIRDVLPASMKDSVKELNDNMLKLWSSTLFGVDEFPKYDASIGTKRDLNGAIEKSEPKGSAKGIMKGLVKQGLKEHKLEENAQEIRKKTLIVYRLPEAPEQDEVKRGEIDQSCVKAVFEALGVDDLEPTNIVRLGQYESPIEGQPPKSRPLKISFDSHDEARRVIENCPKMREAPEHVRKLNIGYDASKEQRANIKALVGEAKVKTAADPNGKVHKVRGPPWQPYLRPYDARAPRI